MLDKNNSKFQLLLLKLLFSVFVIFGIGHQHLFGQSSAENQLKSRQDSIHKVETLDSLAVFYAKTNPRKSIVYADSALKFSQQTKLPAFALKNAELLGKLYFEQREYLKSINAFDLASQLVDAEKRADQYWYIQLQLGLAYYNSGNFTQALELYLEVLKYYEEQKDYNQIAHTKSNIGVLFFRQENLNRSLKYYQEAAEALQKTDHPDKKIEASIETNMGLVYNVKGEYETAEKHYLRSLKINDSLNNSHIKIVNIGNIAATYAERGDYEKAQSYFEQAIAESRKKGDFISEAINTGDLSILLSEMSERKEYKNQKHDLLTQSIEGFQWALDTLGKYKDLRRYQFFSKELSNAWKRKGNYSESLKSYEISMSYKDSLFNEEISRELTRLEIQNDFTKRVDSLRLDNEKKIAVRDAVLATKQKQQWSLWIGILLLAIIGILLFYQNRQKKKNNDKLTKLNQELQSANQVKTRLFGILTHDLRSPISNIVKFLRLKKSESYLLSQEKQLQLETQTQNSAENLLVTMEEMLLWCKMQMEIFEPQIITVDLVSLFNEFEPYTASYPNIDFTFSIEKGLTLQTDENYLKTILRNLTSNAIEAVEGKENPKITWRAFREKDQVHLIISDNGKGAIINQFQSLLDEEHNTEKTTGFGLYLVKEMSRYIGCKFKVETAIGKGTSINIII